MFNVHDAHYQLVKSISELQPVRMGLRATADELENNAGYIEQLCKLVAHHVEEVAAEADAATNAGKIDESHAGFIKDAGLDIAGQMSKAAYATEEEGRADRVRGEGARVYGEVGL